MCKGIIANFKHTFYLNFVVVEKEKEVEEEQPDEPVKYIAALIRILKITRPEWFFILIAAISSVVIGASFPGFSILFGEFYGVCIMIIIFKKYLARSK